MNLSQGILSKKLLEICGDGLQKACSDFAPLNSRDVAVTDANNLPCKFLFHVALPDYQIKNSERVSEIMNYYGFLSMSYGVLQGIYIDKEDG